MCDAACPGYVPVGGDCNDDPDNGGTSFYPGAPDTCGDMLDQDCNGGDGDDEIEYWYPDADGDGFMTSWSHRASTARTPIRRSTSPTTPTATTATATSTRSASRCATSSTTTATAPTTTSATPSPGTLDADKYTYGDADGVVTADCPPDITPYPWTVDSGDCDDDNDAVHPGAPEICNQIDDDCDDKRDAEDDDLTGGVFGYFDRDLDGWGACAGGDPSCDPEMVCAEDLGNGYAESLGDCDDTKIRHGPGRLEEPGNGVDENCDGTIQAGRGPDLEDGRAATAALLGRVEPHRSLRPPVAPDPVPPPPPALR
ncbi:MAG: MopE-related protein [Myxococcota bacterium]